MGQAITPYLCVHDARTALEWYRSHFGASVSNVIEWEGKVGHAELEVAGAVLQWPIESSHGTRHGWLMDPFGHRWNVGTPLPEQEAAAARRAPAEPYYFTPSSPDVERAAAFYGAVLDWRFAEPNEQGGRHVVNTRQPISITSYDSGREAVCSDDQGTTFRLSEPAPGYDPDH